MSLPENVRDAVKELDAAHDQRFAPWRNQWQQVRAHLLSQDAEIARLTEIAESVDPLVIRLGEVTTRLEAANALLRGEAALLRAWARESRNGGWSTHQVDPMNRRADEIDAHLQGDGDEAAD